LLPASDRALAPDPERDPLFAALDTRDPDTALEAAFVPDLVAEPDLEPDPERDPELDLTVLVLTVPEGLELFAKALPDFDPD
jgi:hypothetical protein